jgi:hypothetical protein
MHSIALLAWLISHQPAVRFSQNKPATSNQTAVLSEQTSTSHQPNKQAAYRVLCSDKVEFVVYLCA